jgi:epoxyqueuosine reductase
MVTLLSPVVRTLAREAGFDLCGFARATPIPASTLTDWLEAGMAADMDWMGERLAERLDVRVLLPGAQTVIAVGCNYYQEDPVEDAPIARYARGRDYHATLKDRIRALRRKLEAICPSIETYNSVDTGPVMEKVWAARAGIGYVGRNGCLITEEFGSYVLLAVLIIDAPMDVYADGPAVDRCGGCNLCVTSCPTEAITADGRVDARLCLSYQTIENVEEVPEKLRRSLEGTVFGCDICQDVCPLNGSPVLADARFLPRAVASLGIREIAAMTPEQYRELVPGTPLGRAKYDGLRRNACYALGASGDESAVELLQLLSADSSPGVAAAAGWALTRLRGTHASHLHTNRIFPR